MLGIIVTSNNMVAKPKGINSKHVSYNFYFKEQHTS